MALSASPPSNRSSVLTPAQAALREIGATTSGVASIQMVMGYSKFLAKRMQFRILFSQSQRSLKKRVESKAEALVCVGVFWQ
eukprot:1328948-Pleurochrysis_carterae.AAC.1